MTAEILSFPWQSAIQELSLMRSRQEWATSLEYLGAQLAEAERCWFFLGQDLHWVQPSTGQSWEASDATLLGTAWLRAERVHWESPRGDLAAGLAASGPCWALPIRSFGRIVGFLILEKALHPPAEEVWNAMLELVAHSWDAVGRIEDFAAYQSEAESMMVGAVEASAGSGHVDRVARMAVELARLLDISAHQRQRLQRAGVYHDVGKLLDAQDHARAGGEFLRRGRLLADLAPLVEHHHARYDQTPDLALEIWVLVLAEHFQEFAQAHAGTEPDVLAQRFALQFAHLHHPSVVDALVGLSVAGKLQQLLASSPGEVA